MNKTLLLALAFTLQVFFITLPVSGQGTVYVSTLDQVSDGTLPVASDSWVATYFRTGDNPGGYELGALQILFAGAGGNPHGIVVNLYQPNNAAFSPATVLANLVGPDPLAGGVFPYGRAGVRLLPDSIYWFALSANQPLTSGAFAWSFAHGSVWNDGWSIGESYQKSEDGIHWSRTVSPNIFQFAVSAAPIPEPSGLLLAFGLVSLLIARRARTK